MIMSPLPMMGRPVFQIFMLVNQPPHRCDLGNDRLAVVSGACQQIHVGVRLSWIRRVAITRLCPGALAAAEVRNYRNGLSTQKPVRVVT